MRFLIPWVVGIDCWMESIMLTKCETSYMNIDGDVHEDSQTELDAYGF